MRDGDLWAIVAKCLLARGPRSFAVGDSEDGTSCFEHADEAKALDRAEPPLDLEASEPVRVQALARSVIRLLPRGGARTRRP